MSREFSRMVQELPSARLNEITLSRGTCPTCNRSRSIIARVLLIEGHHVLFCRGGRFSDNAYTVDRINELQAILKTTRDIPPVARDALGEKVIPRDTLCYDLDRIAVETVDLPYFSAAGGCSKCNREYWVSVQLAEPWRLTIEPPRTS